MMEKIMPSSLKATLIACFITAMVFVIAVQFLYTFGQLYHVFLVAYKAGGWMLHLVSFGRPGVYQYFIGAFFIAAALSVFIKRQGGMKNAKVATWLLVISLISTAVFFGLTVLPFIDIVERT